MRNPFLRPAMLALLGLIAAGSLRAAVDGSELYTANCSSCHQASGAGLPNIAPALKGNAYVSGSPAVLIDLLLKGPAEVLPKDRPSFGANTMDAFLYKLNDEEIAAVLTYVRKTFGKDVKSPDVDVKAVEAARARVNEAAGG